MRLLVLAVCALVAPPIDERLESLRPEEPARYFTAAEDAARDGDVELAQALYRRCGAICAGASSPDPSLAASAALGLAALEDAATQRGAAERRYWFALARAIDPSLRPTQAEWASDPERLRFAELIAHYRAGRAVPAQRMGRDAACIDLARRWSALLPGGADAFLAACTGLSAAAPPKLSFAQQDRLLVLESAMLARAHSATDELRAGETAPVPEVDPAALAAAFGLGAPSWWWRGGAWSMTPQ